jgi:hypothetical protein
MRRRSSSISTPSGLPQRPELPCHPRVAVHPFLAAENRKPRSLSHVTVVAWHEHELEVEAAQPHHSTNVVETDGGAAGLPTGDCRLGRAGSACQLGLCETYPPARLANEITTVGRHSQIIAVLL